MEIRDVREYVMVDLEWEEAANAEVEEIAVFWSGSRWVVWVKEGSADRWVIRGGSTLRWGAASEDGGLEWMVIGIWADGVG